MDLFKKEDLIYLTSESDNVIQKIEPDKAYIIGAIVDHNRLKVRKIEEKLMKGNYLRASKEGGHCTCTTSNRRLYEPKNEKGSNCKSR